MADVEGLSCEHSSFLPSVVSRPEPSEPGEQLYPRGIMFLGKLFLAHSSLPLGIASRFLFSHAKLPGRLVVESEEQRGESIYKMRLWHFELRSLGQMDGELHALLAFAVNTLLCPGTGRM